jgi:CrcB protein
MKLVLLFAAGGLGTLLRYGISSLVQRHAGLSFPWGTFAVNMIGCFLFGVAWSVFESRLDVSRELRAVILVGFLGGFTTFSSFAFEGVGLLRDGAILPALGHLIGQNVTGLLLVWVGLAVGRHG